MHITIRDLAVLFSNKVPLLAMRNFMKQQREFDLGNYVSREQPTHSTLEICSQIRLRSLFIRKTYGLRRAIPQIVLTQLADDYSIHVSRISSVGLGPLVKNYRIVTAIDSDNPTMSVEQLFFPFGTAVQWMTNVKAVRSISAVLFRDHLLPLLKKGLRIGSLDCPVCVDLAFKNFAVVPVGSKIHRLYYFDFFPPRIRERSGVIKDLGYPGLHIRSEAEIEYRFFNFVGIVHNVLAKSLIDLTDESLKSSFVHEAERWLDPVLRARFGVSISSLVEMDFTAAMDRFILKNRRRK